ncbi:MAG TPA: hypothetical protein VN673_00640 [Clostridia bacterium]|nr:hypothetical protein [Clostridia bacterium]
MGAASKTFVGFGFGAIQGGLFLYEAFRSGNFGRLVVAEILPEVVAAVRQAGGRYRVNVATPTGIEVHEVSGVEILNPRDPADAPKLAAALLEASEIATALPSVAFYDRGEPSVVSALAAMLVAKARTPGAPACIVYTAENNNQAAEVLERLCSARLGDISLNKTAQFLNTVIGKMSGIVSDPAQVKAEGLAVIAEGLPNAFLVEEFNRILITGIHLPGFHRGIPAFIEKTDLLPFEEAKLYGHNAVHALLGYLATHKKMAVMSDIARDEKLMQLARRAFLEESGRPLIARYGGLDPLFTPEGYAAYVDDLLVRMTNPFLRDRTERVIRDTRRKLGWEDRLVGTMRLALDSGVKPTTFALGVAAALETLPGVTPARILMELWPEADQPAGRKSELIQLVVQAQNKLKTELN